MKFPMLVVMKDGSMDLYESLIEFENCSGCEEFDFATDLGVIIDCDGRRLFYDREFVARRDPEFVEKSVVIQLLTKHVCDVNEWRRRCGKELLAISIPDVDDLTKAMDFVHDALRSHGE